MPKKAVHVTPREDGWAVKREGNKRASSVHPTQREAELRGRQIARSDKTEFFLHDKQGQIRERDSYGSDPTNVIHASDGVFEEGSGDPTPKYESPGEFVRAHALLENFTEEQIIESDRFLTITPAKRGSGSKDVSVNHDRHLFED
jgi:hypothetical protein